MSLLLGIMQLGPAEVPWRAKRKVEAEAERLFRTGDYNGARLRYRDALFATMHAEFVCLRRAALREGPSLQSKLAGHVQPGEIVSVTSSEGNRLQCVRHRWGLRGQSGWASEKDSQSGAVLLEMLPRDEWSRSAIQSSRAVGATVTPTAGGMHDAIETPLHWRTSTSAGVEADGADGDDGPEAEES